MSRWATFSLYICAGLSAGQAHGLSFKYMTDAEIVTAADAVVEGRVVEIIGPRRPGDRRAASVAVIELERVHKGPLARGATLRLLYWSHAGKAPLRWSSPWKYKVGWRGCFVLSRRRPRSYRGFALPPGAAKARWIHWSRYRRGMEASKTFLAAAEAWKDPIKYLGDPRRRGAAVHFLALQKRLDDKVLLRFLTSSRMPDVIAGCRAVSATCARARAASPGERGERAKRGCSRAAIPALVNLALGKHRPAPGPGHYDGIAMMSRQLAAAIEAVGLEPARDEAVLLRLLLEARPAPRGRYGPSTMINWRGMALGLLRTGRPRKRISARLASGLKNAPTPQGIGVLAALDIRRAQPLFLAHHEVARRSSLLRGIRTKRPDLPALRARLGQYRHWTVFQARRGRFHVVPRGRLPALRRALQRDLSELSPLGQEETRWIVDIYSKLNWKGFEQLPRAQLWVAKDGTFAFSWAPEERWGRSKALARLLSAIAP